MSFAAFEPARYAMGDTLRFAAQMNLIEMEPWDDLSLTGYALANRGEGYLVLQPSDRGSFTVALGPGPTPQSGSASRAGILEEEAIVETPAGTSFSAPSSRADLLRCAGLS